MGSQVDILKSRGIFKIRHATRVLTDNNYNPDFWEFRVSISCLLRTSSFLCLLRISCFNYQHRRTTNTYSPDVWEFLPAEIAAHSHCVCREETLKSQAPSKHSCRKQSLFWGSFAKETYNLKEPTNRRNSYILPLHCVCRVETLSCVLGCPRWNLLCKET